MCFSSRYDYYWEQAGDSLERAESDAIIVSLTVEISPPALLLFTLSWGFQLVKWIVKFMSQVRPIGAAATPRTSVPTKKKRQVKIALLKYLYAFRVVTSAALGHTFDL